MIVMESASVLAIPPLTIDFIGTAWNTPDGETLESDILYCKLSFVLTKLLNYLGIFEVNLGDEMHRNDIRSTGMIVKYKPLQCEMDIFNFTISRRVLVTSSSKF